MIQKNISKNHVDENVVRLVATQVFLITLITLLTGWAWLAFFLAVDFGLRAFTRVPSPLATLARGVAKALKLTPKPIFAPPKRFAAILGLFFSVGIAFFLFFSYPNVAYTVGAVLVFCAILEAAFNICLGCYVYNWIVAPLVHRKMNKT